MERVRCGADEDGSLWCLFLTRCSPACRCCASGVHHSHPPDAIYIRTVNQHEVLPKQRAGVMGAATTVKK